MALFHIHLLYPFVNTYNEQVSVKGFAKDPNTKKLPESQELATEHLRHLVTCMGHKRDMIVVWEFTRRRCIRRSKNGKGKTRTFWTPCYPLFTLLLSHSHEEASRICTEQGTTF